MQHFKPATWLLRVHMTCGCISVLVLFVKKLLHNSFTLQKVCALPVKNALWIRICANSGDINSLKVLSSANTCYMVYVPGSAYILLSILKVAYKIYVLKVTFA